MFVRNGEAHSRAEGSASDLSTKCAQMPLLDTCECIGLSWIWNQGRICHSVIFVSFFFLVREEHHLWELLILLSSDSHWVQDVSWVKCLILCHFLCHLPRNLVIWHFLLLHSQALLSKGLWLTLLFRLNYFDVLHEQMLPWSSVWQQVMYHF